MERQPLGGSVRPRSPVRSNPALLPATLDADGCSARSVYSGNRLTDVPGPGGYDQNDAAVIERDVRLAASLCLEGFAVNWNGAGSSTQGAAARPYQHVGRAVAADRPFPPVRLRASSA